GADEAARSIERWLGGAQPRVPRRAREAALGFVRGMTLFRTPVAATLAFVLSLAAWLSEAAAYFLIGRAFGLDLSAADSVAIMIAANLLTALPLTPFGLGVYELGLQEVVAALGAERDRALAYSLGSHALLSVWIIAAGATAAVLMRIRAGDLLYLSRSPQPPRSAPSPDGVVGSQRNGSPDP
ncbi:MAG: flippase-like domain-containing protein, partial [Dehalococcoidia bacterium]|nr:flippase-like domain-containing protein [Dehalococcoidia bacterium]